MSIIRTLSAIGRSNSFGGSEKGHIWPPLLLLLLGGALIAGCTLGLMNRAKAQAEVESKLRLFIAVHPEMHRTTKMAAISNSFERSFGSFYPLSNAIIVKLTEAAANGQLLDSSFAAEPSRSLAFWLAELEKYKNQLRGLSSETDLQKDFQHFLLSDIDLRERLCRELIEMLQADSVTSRNKRSAQLNEVNAIGRTLCGSMIERPVRSLQAIGAAQMSGNENMIQYDELVNESRHLRLATGLALFGRELGFVMIFLSSAFLVVSLRKRR